MINKIYLFFGSTMYGPGENNKKKKQNKAQKKKQKK